MTHCQKAVRSRPVPCGRNRRRPRSAQRGTRGGEPDPLRGIQRHDLDQQLAGLGDDERLALCRAVDQARQVRFSLVNIDGQHRLPPR